MKPKLPRTDFEDAHPKDILKWAYETFGDQLVIMTSFQPTGIVSLHMLSEIAAQAPTVLTLDTGLLFEETYRLMDTVEQHFGVKIIRVKPALDLEQQAELYEDKLWETQPDTCCHWRKVVPLKGALAAYGAWITGVRRDQSAFRAKIPIVSWDERTDTVKICPLANWTEEMIWAYIHAYDLPYNDLHDKNYPSIGCKPCTQAVSDGGYSRAGRWANRAKTECGIHSPAKDDEKYSLPQAEKD